jgi:OmpA-OmpF porin, OOP family
MPGELYRPRRGAFSQQRGFDTITDAGLNWISKRASHNNDPSPQARRARLRHASRGGGGGRLPGRLAPSQGRHRDAGRHDLFRAADSGHRFKLGYKYSRYLSVESEFVDFGRTPADLFTSPGNLASAFRSTGIGIDTVATLPLWRSFSFYGRMGAYHGDARNAFATYSTSLLGDGAARGTRWRYGLGVRYEFTKAFGIHAELERYSPLGSPLAGEPDADLVSVGVAWRF